MILNAQTGVHCPDRAKWRNCEFKRRKCEPIDSHSGGRFKLVASQGLRSRCFVHQMSRDGTKARMTGGLSKSKSARRRLTAGGDVEPGWGSLLPCVNWPTVASTCRTKRVFMHRISSFAAPVSPYHGTSHSAEHAPWHTSHAIRSPIESCPFYVARYACQTHELALSRMYRSADP